MNRRLHARYCLLLAFVTCLCYWAYFHQKRLHEQELKSISPAPIMDCSGYSESLYTEAPQQ